MTSPATDDRGALTGEGRSSRRGTFILLGAVAISLSILLSALFGKRGMFEVMRYERERVRLQAEIAVLEAEVRALEEDLARLGRDPSVLERIAREELSLGRPGEAVIFLPAPPRSTTTLVPPQP